MTSRDVALLAAAPVIYLVLLAAGRVVKRRWGVRFGATYHLFALSAAAFPPVWFMARYEIVRTVEAALILFGTIVVLALVQRLLWEIYLGRKEHRPVPKFVGEVFNLVIFVIVVLVILSTFYSVRIPGLLAGSGILAIILGLAMQDTLGNILAGLALHFEKPFQTGDWLVMDNRHAQVMEMNWRATRLRTTDDIYLDIPNSQLAKTAIVNLSYPTTTHAMRLRVGVDYNMPPNSVKEVLARAASEAQGVLASPKPAVFLVEFGDSAVVYEVKYWLADHARFNEITDRVRTNLWYELKRNGMRIPFPMRTVEMVPAPAGADGKVGQLLRQQPLFTCFTDADILRIAGGASQYTFGRGESIIRQGEAGASMFLLVRGRAIVTVASNGESARVGELHSGDCFGEMSLLTGEPRSATIIAETDCEVVEIGKDALVGMLQQSPNLVHDLGELLARRKVQTDDALAHAAHARLSDREREYATTFVQRVKAFFEL